MKEERGGKSKRGEDEEEEMKEGTFLSESQNWTMRLLAKPFSTTRKGRMEKRKRWWGREGVGANPGVMWVGRGAGEMDWEEISTPQAQTLDSVLWGQEMRV